MKKNLKAKKKSFLIGWIKAQYSGALSVIFSRWTRPRLYHERQRIVAKLQLRAADGQMICLRWFSSRNLEILITRHAKRLYGIKWTSWNICLARVTQRLLIAITRRDGNPWCSRGFSLIQKTRPEEGPASISPTRQFLIFFPFSFFLLSHCSCF